ncbi:MAG: phosphotransferase family protein [Caulobacterales bacterium]
MRDALSARILDAAIKSLRAEILPKLPQDEATGIRFDQITRLLRNVSTRLSSRDAALVDLLKRAAADPAYAYLNVNTEAADPEEERRRLEAAMASRLPDLLSDAPTPEKLEALEALVDLERSFFLALDGDIAAGSQVVYRGGRIDSEEPTGAGAARAIDEQSLSTYLQSRYQKPTVRATNVRTIPGGFSKQTLFFTLEDGVSNPSDLVIRKDMPQPFIQKTVLNEYPLLKNLLARNFPVAEPLWLETDTKIFDGAFIVSRRVDGTSNASAWAADPDRAKKACAELAKVVAKLHAFEPRLLGTPEEEASLSAGAHIERDIAQWTRLFHKSKTEPLPLGEVPIVWLAKNIPTQLYERPARIVHGDVGFHNLMFDDQGEVTALLDWEFAVLGDPTQDLCFLKNFVQPMMPWDDFMAIYLEHGGVAPCQEAEFFFDLWSRTRNAIGCVDAQRLFDTHLPDEVKFALAGHIFGPYMYLDQCQTLIEHLKTKQA